MKEKAAKEDKENPNMEDIKSKNKALNFLQKLEKMGEAEYPRFKTFVKVFYGLILQIEVSCHNGETNGFQYIYFPKHPVFTNVEDPFDRLNYPKFMFLADETRDNVMMFVGR